MTLRIRFRFDGKCGLHPRYDPARDGRPQHGNCEGCESLYVIHLYIRIAKRRAREGKGLAVRRPPGEEVQPASRTPHCHSHDANGLLGGES